MAREPREREALWRITSGPGSILGEQLGRAVAFHSIGKDGDDAGFGAEAVGGHQGGAAVEPRAGTDGEPFANQAAGHVGVPIATEKKPTNFTGTAVQ
jgi:hypothetical protein